jgi:hypothetical protein
VSGRRRKQPYGSQEPTRGLGEHEGLFRTVVPSWQRPTAGLCREAEASRSYTSSECPASSRDGLGTRVAITSPYFPHISLTFCSNFDNIMIVFIIFIDIDIPGNLLLSLGRLLSAKVGRRSAFSSYAIDFS